MGSDSVSVRNGHLDLMSQTGVPLDNKSCNRESMRTEAPPMGKRAGMAGGGWTVGAGKLAAEAAAAGWVAAGAGS